MIAPLGDSSCWLLVLSGGYSLIADQCGLTCVTFGSTQTIYAADWINMFIQSADQDVVDQQQFVTLSPTTTFITFKSASILPLMSALNFSERVAQSVNK